MQIIRCFGFGRCPSTVGIHHKRNVRARHLARGGDRRGSPLMQLNQAITAFEAVDPNLQAASRTLGASPLRTFFRVTLPLALGASRA